MEENEDNAQARSGAPTNLKESGSIPLRCRRPILDQSLDLSASRKENGINGGWHPRNRSLQTPPQSLPPPPPPPPPQPQPPSLLPYKPPPLATPFVRNVFISLSDAPY